MKRCYLFDIDGTLSDLSHRLHHILKEPKDWDAFFADCVGDSPIEHICELAQNLNRAGYDIVIVSGRSDAVRQETLTWLQEYVYWHPSRCHLYMRKAGDHRPDNVVKAEMLAQVRAAGFEPIMAFEDRSRVVKMWRAHGIPCAQVAPGDF